VRELDVHHRVEGGLEERHVVVVEGHGIFVPAWDG
jgi:hypothetical protein